MTVVFSNGFEEGDFREYSSTYRVAGCTLEVTSTKAFQGMYSLHWKSNSLANDNGAAFKNSFCINPAYLREYYNFAQLNIPVGSIVYLSYIYGAVGTETVGPTIFNDAGILKLGLNSFEGGVGQNILTTITPVIGNWYAIEVMRDVEQGTLSMWVNDALVISTSRAITVNTIGAAIGCGFQNDVGLIEYYIDSIDLSTGRVGIPLTLYEQLTTAVVVESEGARVRTLKHTSPLAPTIIG